MNTKEFEQKWRDAGYTLVSERCDNIRESCDNDFIYDYVVVVCKNGVEVYIDIPFYAVYKDFDDIDMTDAHYSVNVADMWEYEDENKFYTTYNNYEDFLDSEKCDNLMTKDQFNIAKEFIESDICQDLIRIIEQDLQNKFDFS